MKFGRNHDSKIRLKGLKWRQHVSLLSAVDDRPRPEERRRNELYRQYYEEIQRRYDTDRPVDCSVIVVNKAQKYVRCLKTQNCDQKHVCENYSQV